MCSGLFCFIFFPWGGVGLMSYGSLNYFSLPHMYSFVGITLILEWLWRMFLSYLTSLYNKWTNKMYFKLFMDSVPVMWTAGYEFLHFFPPPGWQWDLGLFHPLVLSENALLSINVFPWQIYFDLFLGDLKTTPRWISYWQTFQVVSRFPSPPDANMKDCQLLSGRSVIPCISS